MIVVDDKNNKVACDVCGEATAYKCMGCVDKTGKPGAPMHFVHFKGAHAGHNTCFIRHHCERYCGLKRSDCHDVGKRLKDWKAPTKREVEDNGKHVKRLRMAEKEMD